MSPEIEWKSGIGGEHVFDKGKIIASVWLATTHKQYMFWACDDPVMGRKFWYEDSIEKAKQEAEKILRESYFK